MNNPCITCRYSNESWQQGQQGTCGECHSLAENSETMPKYVLSLLYRDSLVNTKKDGANNE